MTEVDFVEIGLENFVFGEASFDHESDARFRELARNGAPRRQESIFRKLLCDRAAAFRYSASPGIRYNRSTDSYGIDSNVTSESGVFSGEEGIRHVAGQVGKNHRLGQFPV